MFRTVKPEALDIITFIHPDLPQQWTSAAPLYCAAYKETERSHPWYDVTTKGQIKASGVSLRTLDSSPEVTDIFDPFSPIRDQEQTGKSVMTLEQYVVLTKGEPHETHGILITSVSHRFEGKGEMIDPKSSSVSIDDEKAKKTRKTKNLATKRTIWIRYKLRAGTDLSKYKVAVVYDNSSKNHVTMVPTGGEGFGDFGREWMAHPLLKAFLPFDAFDKIQGLKKGSDESREYLKMTCSDHLAMNQKTLAGHLDKNILFSPKSQLNLCFTI